MYLSNEAINASYDYTSAEIDLMICVIQAVKPDDKSDLIKLSLNSLVNVFRTDANSGYDTVRRALRSIQMKPYEIYYPQDQKYFCANFITSSEITKFSGQILVTMHPKIKAMVLNIKERYTSFEIVTLLRLRSKYAKRFYMMISQFKNTGHRTVSIAELRKTMHVTDCYALTSELMRRVVHPAIAELNKESEFIVEVRTAKRGRAITEFELLIKAKKELAETNGLDKQELFMKQCGLAEWQITNVFLSLDKSEIHQVLYQFNCIKNTIKNKGAYLAQTFTSKGVVMNRAIPRQTNIIDQINENTNLGTSAISRAK